MGPSGDRVANAFYLYHCQYEKSATPPSLFRTILIAPPTKQGGDRAAGPGLLRSCAPGRDSTPDSASGPGRMRLSFFRFVAMSLSPFRAFLFNTRRSPAFGSSIMIGFVRAVTICATLAFGLVAAQAADKAFKRDDLVDSAIKLEAQIKSEAGPVSKSGAALRTDADTAFRRNDYRTGLQILGQIAATSPDDSANWLRLARTIFQVKPSNSSEQTFLLERA